MEGLDGPRGEGIRSRNRQQRPLLSRGTNRQGLHVSMPKVSVARRLGGMRHRGGCICGVASKG